MLIQYILHTAQARQDHGPEWIKPLLKIKNTISGVCILFHFLYCRLKTCSSLITCWAQTFRLLKFSSVESNTLTKSNKSIIQQTHSTESAQSYSWFLPQKETKKAGSTALISVCSILNERINKWADFSVDKTKVRLSFSLGDEILEKSTTTESADYYCTSFFKCHCTPFLGSGL